MPGKSEQLRGWLIFIFLKMRAGRLREWGRGRLWLLAHLRCAFFGLKCGFSLMAAPAL
jgi:hypothetical protein